MVLLMASAQAQVGGGNGAQNSQLQGASGIGAAAGRANQDPAGDQKVKANDKAYNAVLKNLPDKQYDPWHGVRDKQ